MPGHRRLARSLGRMSAAVVAGLAVASCGGGEDEVGLRDLGVRAGVRVGAAALSVPIANDVAYDDTLRREYDSITPENGLKWVLVHPEPHVYRWPDLFVDYAEMHGMEVRGGPLAWALNPAWVNRLPAAQLERVLREHIQNVVGHYRGRIAEWDVVNEAITADGELADNIWLRGIGPDYIDKAFRWAHGADPDARLYYNDFGAEGLGPKSPKSGAVYNLVRTLKDRGVPIDGVGLQMHITSDVPPGIDRNMRRLAALGLDIAVTEMDVRLPLPPRPASREAQAEAYVSVVRSCLRQPRCRGITTWGFTDRASWVPGTYPGYGVALPFDRRYGPKPAYRGIRRALRAGRPES